MKKMPSPGSIVDMDRAKCAVFLQELFEVYPMRIVRASLKEITVWMRKILGAYGRAINFDEDFSFSKLGGGSPSGKGRSPVRPSATGPRHSPKQWVSLSGKSVDLGNQAPAVADLLSGTCDSERKKEKEKE